MRVFVGCDHRGLEFKQFVMKQVAEAGHSREDLGIYTEESVDYPDIAKKVAEAVNRKGGCGILICGTGIGMSIAANKVKGIRAALCHNVFTARRARRHNDANILCLAAEGGRVRVPGIIKTFLNTDFEGGRHQKRLDKIKDMECQ